MLGYCLKGQMHDIFYPCFFIKIIRHLIQTLNVGLRMQSRNCLDIQILSSFRVFDKYAD
jgi:hypothetical protein